MAATYDLQATFTKLLAACGPLTENEDGFHTIGIREVNKLQDIVGVDNSQLALVLEYLAKRRAEQDISQLMPQLNYCLNALLVVAVNNNDLRSVQILLHALNIKGNILFPMGDNLIVPPLAKGIAQNYFEIVEEFFKKDREYSNKLLALEPVSVIVSTMIESRSNKLLTLLKNYQLKTVFKRLKTSYLYSAVQASNLVLIQWLIEDGELIYSEDVEDRKSPLLQAARQGDIEIVKYLLAHGASFAESENDLDLFQLALPYLAQPPWQEFLAQHSAVVDNSNLLASFAIMQGQIDVVKMFKETFNYNFTAFDLQQAFIKFLLRSENDATQLTWILEQGVNWLEENIMPPTNGEDVECICNALEWVCQKKPQLLATFLPFVIDMLKKTGEDELYVNYQGQRLPFVFVLAQTSSFAIFSDYICKIVSKDLFALTDSDGNNILHFLVKSGKYELVKFLLKGVDLPECKPQIFKAIRALNKDYKTPLHLAIDIDDLPFLHRFLEVSPDTINVVDGLYGFNLLHYAVSIRRNDKANAIIVEFLLGRRAKFTVDPLLINKDGHGALSLACKAGNYKAVEKLLFSDWDARQHPLLLAIKSGSLEIAKLLVEENVCPLEPLVDVKEPSLLLTVLESPLAYKLIKWLEYNITAIGVDFKRLIAASGQTGQELLAKVSENANSFTVLLRYIDNYDEELLFKLALEKGSIGTIKALVIKKQSFPLSWRDALESKGLLNKTLTNPYLMLFYHIEINQVSAVEVTKYKTFIPGAETSSLAEVGVLHQSVSSQLKEALEVETIKGNSSIAQGIKRNHAYRELQSLRLAAINQGIAMVVEELNPRKIFPNTMAEHAAPSTYGEHAVALSVFPLLQAAIVNNRVSILKYLLKAQQDDVAALSVEEQEALLQQAATIKPCFNLLKHDFIMARYAGNNNITTLQQSWLEKVAFTNITDALLTKFASLAQCIDSNFILVTQSRGRTLVFTIVEVEYGLFLKELPAFIESCSHELQVQELINMLQARSLVAKESEQQLIEKKKACEFALIHLEQFINEKSPEYGYKAWQVKLELLQQQLKKVHKNVTIQCLAMHNLFEYYRKQGGVSLSAKLLDKMQAFSKRYDESVSYMDARYNEGFAAIEHALALIVEAKKSSFDAIKATVMLELTHGNIIAAQAILDNFLLVDRLKSIYDGACYQLRQLEGQANKHNEIMEGIQKSIDKQVELTNKIAEDKEARAKWALEQQEIIKQDQALTLKKTYKQNIKADNHSEFVNRLPDTVLSIAEGKKLQEVKAIAQLQYLLWLAKAGQGVADKRVYYRITFGYALLQAMADIFEEFKSCDSRILPAAIATKMRDFLWHDLSPHITTKVSFSKLLQSAKWLLSYLADDTKRKEVLVWCNQDLLKAKRKIEHMIITRLRLATTTSDAPLVTSSLDKLQKLYGYINNAQEDQNLQTMATSFILGKLQAICRDNNIDYTKYAPLKRLAFIPMALKARHGGAQILPLAMSAEQAQEFASNNLTTELITNFYDMLPLNKALWPKAQFIAAVIADNQGSLLQIAERVLQQEIIIYPSSPAREQDMGATPLPRLCN